MKRPLNRPQKSTESVCGDEVTATFLWAMCFLGKGWDIESDEGPPTYGITLEAFFPDQLAD